MFDTALDDFQMKNLRGADGNFPIRVTKFQSLTSNQQKIFDTKQKRDQ